MNCYYNIVKIIFKIIFSIQIEYDNIGMSDIFGVRGLYETDSKKRISKLTFLSDSFYCEIYRLDKSNLCYIPE